MTKIARASQKVFAGGIVATNNISVYGSLKAGTPTYSNDPATIQSLDAWIYGWGSAVVSNQAPALQDVNAVDYLLSRQIAYLLQQGIAEYDADTEYHQHSYCSVNGVLYRSVQNTNLNHAVTDNTWWLAALTPNTTGGALGNVPIGSAIPIVNAQVWTLPASGEVKDGYALCNGQTFASLGAGNYHPSFSGSLPNISDARFLMGSTAIGAVGGANSFTLAAGNIPQISTSYTPAGTNSASGVSGTTNIAHTHAATGVTGTVDIAHNHGASSISGTTGTMNSNTSHSHTYTATAGAGSGLYGATSQVSSTTPATSTVNIDHTHAISGTAGGQTLGSTPVALASGVAGGQTLGATNVGLASGVAAAQGFTGTAATITVGTASPSSVENRPLYFACVFVMRVK